MQKKKRPELRQRVSWRGDNDRVLIDNIQQVSTRPGLRLVAVTDQYGDGHLVPIDEVTETPRHFL